MRVITKTVNKSRNTTHQIAYDEPHTQGQNELHTLHDTDLHSLG